MTFDNEALAELSRLLNTSSLQEYVAKEEREEHARGLRGEVTANWLDKFMDRMSQDTPAAQGSDNLVNEATGESHTVESMVEQYRDAVGLDAIQKSANIDFPLSKKLAAENGIVDFPNQKKKPEIDEEADARLLGEMVQAIHDHLGSHRGYSDTQAVVYDLRESFGDVDVERHSERIMEEIEEAKTQYTHEDPAGRLPYAPKDQPLKINYGPSDEDNIFRNIRDQGGPNAR
jgi:hypothetical protein